MEQDPLATAWKRQLDAGFRLLETLLEGATRLREAQLEAATEAHAAAVATQKSLAGAAGMGELLQLQTQWAAANAEQCLAYWRAMYEIAAEIGGELMKCACSQAPAELPQPFLAFERKTA